MVQKGASSTLIHSTPHRNRRHRPIPKYGRAINPFTNPRSGQFPVFNPVRLIRLNAQSPLAIRFIIGVIALKPQYLRIAFKGQNMGRNPIQKPAIMGDNHRATGKGQQGFFQCPQGFHIQIIGRFIQ